MDATAWLLAVMTPELFSDRGIAWIKAMFEVSNQAITNFGLLALAAISVYQNIMQKADVKAAVEGVKERLDRQGQKIENNTQAITAVALAVPAAEDLNAPAKKVIIENTGDPVDVKVVKP